MTIADIAKDFTELLQQGDHLGAGEKYNADDIVSLEAMEGPMAIAHGGSVEGPYVNGDQFAVRFKFDITPKATGERVTMDEVGVYTVKNGKITEERFYY
ncbi:nuclear transport factor 2 family protein [Mesorhizobium caraganae]|uniref:nuclear transport factor 2 family protein n=1 Tax=Mesorhizobium caraganae TaxID=483206 RepID=UPI003335F1D5